MKNQMKVCSHIRSSILSWHDVLCDREVKSIWVSSLTAALALHEVHDTAFTDALITKCVAILHLTSLTQLDALCRRCRRRTLRAFESLPWYDVLSLLSTLAKLNQAQHGGGCYEGKCKYGGCDDSLEAMDRKNKQSDSAARQEVAWVVGWPKLDGLLWV